ncbi:MAG TPA: peptidase M61 [Bacteroidia bacterium]|nr:peptidase M61 [Bacteroidia bacterium]
MRRLFLFSLCFAFTLLSAQQTNQYQFSLDLTKVHEDKLTVELITPVMATDSVVYRMPAMVPGTYKVYNFGRFISNLKATDKNGKALEIDTLDRNSWTIRNAKTLYKISYDVEDTWDTKQKSNQVFEPAGTNIEDSNFVLNNHGFFGYFDKMKRNEYVVNITRPVQMFGSTGLTNITRTGNTDTYRIPNYMDLVDGPIMYCRPDTTHLNIGGTDVLISVYSPKGLISSRFVADSLHGILEAQRQYLGGTLPVKNYAFIIYLTGNPRGFNSGSYGALEHSYSSMYTLIEQDPAFIAQMIKDVAAHEFFHIVTPLNIHSEEIGDFDFNDPQMSQHLWMYEGLTEYSAHHVQVKYGNQSMEDFLAVMSEKISRSMQFDDEMSFTDMSKQCLGKTEDEYLNVYQKGALIACCLDLKLRYLSGGAYGTQELMRDLAKKYGKDSSFQDDSLFSNIVALTYPEIGVFLNKHVKGGEALPFAECFGYAGIEYKRKKKLTIMDPLGGFGYYIDSNKRVVLYPVQPNLFGKRMGYMKGDILVSINGKKIKAATVAQQLKDIEAGLKPDQMVKVKVLRKNSSGKLVSQSLSEIITPIEKNISHYLGPVDNPTPEQLKIRKAWINK